MIRSDRKKIIFVKSLMGKKLDSFFFPHKIDQKVASYWLVSVTTHYNCIEWSCIRCLKIYRIAMVVLGSFEIFAARRQSLDSAERLVFATQSSLICPSVCLCVCLSVRTNENLRMKNSTIKNWE